MKRLNLVRAVLVIALAASAVAAQADAPALTLSKDGVVIPDGKEGSVTLQYPIPVDAAKKRATIANVTIDDAKTRATVEFKEGGKIVTDVSGGAIVYTASELPAGTKTLWTFARMPVAYAAGAKYAMGKGPEKEFPATAGTQNFDDSKSGVFVMTVANGGRLALAMEPGAYQQMQDGRAYKSANFLWQAWMPYAASKSTYTVKVGDAAIAVAGTELLAPTAPPKPAAAAMENKTPAPVIDAAVGTSVQKWRGAKRVGFYLSFDDACPTHLTNVIPELEKRKIVGTFYIIAGAKQFTGNQKKWAEAARSPYVVLANHTLTHKDFPTMEKFEQELDAANKVLDEVQPLPKPHALRSFGKPGGVQYGFGESEIGAVVPKHDLIYRLPFVGGGMTVKTPEGMRNHVNAAVRKGDIGHLDFHGVGGDWLVTSMPDFIAFLDALQANDQLMWISDSATVMKYAAERKGAKVNVAENGPERIRLTVTTDVDPAQFDVPLTLATRVPKGWEKVEVVQGERKQTVDVQDGVAMYEALPTGAEIVFTGK